MTRHLLQLKKLSVTHLSILMVGLSAMTGEVRAAHDIYEGAIRHAEGEIANSGEAAAAARAKVFAREICRRLVPEIHNSTDAKRFLDRYDQVQQEREQGVSEVRRILRESPADAEGRAFVEEGIRMALLLRDARTEVIQCIKEGRAEIPNGDKTGAAKTSVSGPGQNAPSQSESQVESDIPRPNAGNGDSGRADVKELMVLVRKALREARIGYRGLGVSGNTVRVEISQKTPDTIADARARLQRLADLFNSGREGDKVVVTVAGGKFELSLATR